MQGSGVLQLDAVQFAYGKYLIFLGELAIDT